SSSWGGRRGDFQMRHRWLACRRPRCRRSGTAHARASTRGAGGRGPAAARHRPCDSSNRCMGDYSMMRAASGTSWQPDSTPREGIPGLFGDWTTMVQGFNNEVYDNQGGPRGGHKTFSESMLMGMAQTSLGPGHLMLRGMISLDPMMGKSGYPLLLQAGET